MEDKFIIYDSENADEIEYGDVEFDLMIMTDRPIVVIADLDRWCGHKLASTEFSYSLIPLLTEGNFDHNVLYLEGDDVYKTAAHHDGTNKYLYREMKPDCKYEDFIADLSDFDDWEAIHKYTNPIGKYIKRIYEL